MRGSGQGKRAEGAVRRRGVREGVAAERGPAGRAEGAGGAGGNPTSDDLCRFARRRGTIPQTTTSY
ncbi:hypothetical protein TNCT1_24370 [Streptomyces sp. 1-11]|nr:hypothetical protein TNCT1_24370 [Streptomyces sp. 1-11]